MERSLSLSSVVWSVALFGVLQSCSGVSNTPVPGHEVKSDKQRIMSPDVSDSDIYKLVTGNNSFAFEMYHALAQTSGDGEVFFSPYSISLALAMTWAGARSETESQMAEVLHFDLEQSALHPAFDFLDLALMSRGKGALGQDGDGFRLRVVNSIWGQDGHQFLDSFLDVLAQNYGAGLHLMDFENDPEGCIKVINDWVEAITDDRIKDLIPAGSLDRFTKLVLVNAIYFNAAWAIPFEEYDTGTAEFHTLSGRDMNVEMMHQTTEVDYAEGDGFKAIELPYDGRELSMVLILPNPGSFRKVEQSLNVGSLEALISSMDLAQVRISLPKWEYTSGTIDLENLLSELGMPVAFERGKADFSGIDGMINLFISKVLHKAFISVDEDGTEAAASTTVVMTDGGMSDGGVPDQEKIFRANRSFVYLIRDMETGSILFMGRTTSPLKSRD